MCSVPFLLRPIFLSNLSTSTTSCTGTLGPALHQERSTRSSRVGKKREQLLNSTPMTSFQLKLKEHIPPKTYHLFVWASYNQTVSPGSEKFTFAPYSDTIIGPPELLLAGCGNCIQINISLPEAERSSGIRDIQKHYDADFRISFQKKGKSAAEIKTSNKTYTLQNLETDTEYCIQVHTEIRTNKNTKPSVWKCIFTSIVEPRRDSVVLGAVAVLLIVVISVLMTFTYFLYYTGFLCKLKTTLPRVLIMALSQGYTLTPENTILDLISINSEMQKQSKHNKTTPPCQANRVTNSEEEDEDEEEVEGLKVYMDRDPGLSSGDSSCQCTGNKLGNGKPSVSGDCASLKERLSAEVEVPDTEFEFGVVDGELDQDEAKTEGGTVSFILDEGQTGVQEQVTVKEEENEDVCDSSGNVNLFSVTLAALAACEEGEQNTRDFLKHYDQEPELSTVSKSTLSHTDSQTESDDQTTMALMQTTHEKFAETGYEVRDADTLSGSIKACEEEEEEEEEFSGYMAHR
ncbi:cytokine receptor family member b1 isoform X2 [Mastacembelus armatus]|uniref:cytokine receptor family member b1 isoform X2 n=1 Tax=Mastacembelus armatus TaxID=205130 RepID=UPI000E46613E|nr:uncharacterized protein LOC113123434 isoform X2 [Mastacembelus armatus]